MNGIKRAFAALNDYFFDVDPGEPIDWPSVAIFYGCNVVIVLVGLTVVFIG